PGAGDEQRLLWWIRGQAAQCSAERNGAAGLRAAGLLLLTTLAAGCARNVPAIATPSAPQPLQLKLPLYPSGAMHDLAEDRGSVVLLDVWATWCEPCKAALPLYQELYRKYGPQGLKVYAINIDEDPRQITPFLMQHNLDLPVLLDSGAKVAEDAL